MATNTYPCGKAGCSGTVQYFEAHCAKCGTLHSFPNVRVAAAEQADLDRRFGSAVSAVIANGAGALLPIIEQIAADSRVVLAMDVNAADNLTRAGKYRNYYQRIRGPERPPAAENHHAERVMVDARLFPHYQEHMQFLTLSLTGRSLLSYGQVAMRLKNSIFLESRASLLERNSFLFFDAHNLGKLGTNIPSGYRAKWVDRKKLVVAKIANSATSTSTRADLEKLFFDDQSDRKRDEFIEVHVYAEKGIDWSEFDQVMLQATLTDADDQARWALVVSSCKSRNLAVIP